MSSGKTRDELHRDARRGDLLSILRLTEAELDRVNSDLEELAELLVEWSMRHHGYRDYRWRLRGTFGDEHGAMILRLLREALERRAARAPRGQTNPGRERVAIAVADTVAAIRRRRGLVTLTTTDAEVRYIAKTAAEYALELKVNPPGPA